MTYGLGYMGSKSRIAEKIVGLFPKSKKAVHHSVFFNNNSLIDDIVNNCIADGGYRSVRY